MLSAAILCPGPSLVAFADRGGYDLRIGVNRAVGLFRCDYWAMLDERSFEITRPLGRPVIVCTHGEFIKLQNRLPAAKQHHGYALEDIALKLEHKSVTWHNWSATVAIAAAFSLGATTIDVFGMDWAGAQDFDGYTDCYQNRTDERWQRERRLFQALAAKLTDRGCRVMRVVGDELKILRAQA